MSENPQELVEAKLLAYVEGDLDEADRAEIERHLEANSKHRALLADLQVGRKWIRGLRREAAPNELFDGVQSQLERQLLLDVSTFPKLASTHSEASHGPAEELDDSMKIHRRARLRFAAAAAIVLGGIGVVIYSSLPAKQGAIAENTGKPTAVTPEGEKGGLDGLRGSAKVVTPASQSLEQANGVASVPVGPFQQIEKSAAASPAAPVVPNVAPSLNRPAGGRREEMAELADRARSAPAVQKVLQQLRRNPEAAKTAPNESLADGGRHPAKPSGENQDRVLKGMDDAHAKQSDAQKGAVGANMGPAVLVIASADPVESRRQLAELLKEQNFSYRQVELAEAAPLRKSAAGESESQLNEKRARGLDRPTDPAAAPSAGDNAPLASDPMGKSADKQAPGAAAPGSPVNVPAPIALPAAPMPGAPTPTPAPTQAPPVPAPVAPSPAVPQIAPIPAHSPAVPNAPGTAPIFDRRAMSSATKPTTLPVSQDVVVLVRIPRSRANKLVSSLSRSGSSQILFSAADDAGSSTRQSFFDGVSPSTAPRPSQPPPGQEELARNQYIRKAADPAGKMGDLARSAASGPSTKPAGPIVNRGADEGVAGVLPDVPESSPARPAQRSVSPFSAPPALASKPASANGGTPAKARTDGKIALGEAVQLIRSLRPGGPPVAMRIRVDERAGTIWILGLGEVTIGGLTPEEASALVTKKLKEKSPDAQAVEIRRLPEEPAMAMGGSGGGAGQKADGGLGGVEPMRPFKDEGFGNPSPKPLPASIAPAAAGSAPSGEGTDAKGEELIDLVIVVQRTPEVPTTQPATQP